MTTLLGPKPLRSQGLLTNRIGEFLVFYNASAFQKVVLQNLGLKQN